MGGAVASKEPRPGFLQQLEKTASLPTGDIMDAKEPNVAKAALFSRCPRCGIGSLFNGYLSVGLRCPHCGLDFANFDPGDGPAVFVILIEGAVVLAAVLWLEFTFGPPWWVHAVLWPPLIGILTMALLRLVKSVLIVLQYRYQAGEGKRLS